MKKYIVLLVLTVLLSGCGKVKVSDVGKELEKKYLKSNGYSLTGELEINSNDDLYHYDIDVSYMKDDFYRITMKNKSNDFVQMILKNNDGVFLYTPSLNKSFKFQSDWPYNHSQIYLLNSIIQDIKQDNNSTIEEKNNLFYITTSVHYPNNSNLTSQKIVVDKKYSLKKVTVYNSNGQICMEFVVDKMKYSPSFSKDYFELDSITDIDSSDEEEEKTQETGVLEDIIYPLFIPDGTKLIDEEKVKKETGERVIMTYDGEKSFLLVEETQDVFQELTIIPSSGEPYQLMDTIGVMTDNSLSWSSGGMDYYLVSDVMSQQELLDIAQSIVGIPSMK